MYDACRYLQLCYVENIPVAGLSCMFRSLLPLAPELRPSICISIRGLGNVIEPSVGGPDDHRRSSGIASRASRNVLTTNGLFYRFAKRHVVTFDRSFIRVSCVRAAYCACASISACNTRQGRVSFKYIYSDMFIILFYIILYISLFLFAHAFLQVKCMTTFSIHCYLFYDASIFRTISIHGELISHT